MLKLTLGLSFLVFSSSITAGNGSEITVMDKTLKLLEGFDDVSVGVFVNDEAEKCYIQEQALLTKALLSVSKTKMRIEEDGAKADAVLMIGVETIPSKDGFCLTKVGLTLSALAATYFDRANVQKQAMVPLFQEYKLIYSEPLDHYNKVGSATDELLSNFIYKWEYFNYRDSSHTSNKKE